MNSEKQYRTRQRPTLRDIARVLSVTTATVSKALNNGTDISDEMKDRVRKVAEEMGYRPNFLARALINQRTRVIGVLVPDLRISFFSEAVRGIYEESGKKGYESLVLVHDETPAKERQKLEFLSDVRVDGILLNAAGGKTNYPVFKKLAEQGIRIVCWDRQLEGLDFRSVKIDDVKASYDLTSKIIYQGRKRVLFLGPHSGIALLKDRYDGYRKALKEHGIPIRDELVVRSFRSAEDSYEKVLTLLKKRVKFDAIVSIGGLITYGAGKAVLDKGLSIPDDVLIGEFGDNEIVYKLGVPFYSVSQNPYLIGKISADMLVKMIETGKPDSEFQNVIVDAEVVERGPVWVNQHFKLSESVSYTSS